MDSKQLLQLFSKSFFAVVFLAMMGFQTASAQSTIYYVSSTNGSASFNGMAATNTSGINGPKQSFADGLALASDGDTISIEAGDYTGEAFDVDAAVTIVVRAAIGAPSITVAEFGGATVTIDPGDGETVTLNSGDGSIETSAGTFTLESGTLALAADKLEFTADPLAVAVNDGTASGATPTYAGTVNATYDQSGTTATTAGTELPADLDGGTLTIAATQAADITFGSALDAGAISNGSAEMVTFSGAVETSGDIDNNNAAGDMSFAAVTVGGDFTHAGDDVTAASIDASNGTVSTSGAAGQTLDVSGAVTFSQTASNTTNVTVGAGSTVTFGSLAFNPVADAGDDDDNYLSGLQNNGGTFTVSGTTSDGSVDDGGAGVGGTDITSFAVNNADAAAVSTFTGAVSMRGGIFANVAGASFTFGSTLSNAGGLTSAGTVTMGGASATSGVVNNTGTIELGSNTLTLAGDAAHTALGTFEGASSTVAVTGDADVSGIDTEGNLDVSGDGSITAAADVDGNLTISGDGDIAAATTVGGWAMLSGDNDVSAVLDVTGAATFGGSHTVSSAGNMVGGAATFSGDTTVTGDLEIGSGTVGASGSLDITGATLTSHGDFTSGTGGTFTAGVLAFDLDGDATFQPGPNTSVDDLTVEGAFTLTLGQSVFITTLFDVDAASTVALGDFLIRMSGASAAAVIDGALTTADGQSGTLAFEGATQTLTGLGEISNILVNNASTVTVGATTEIDFTGILSLVDGGIIVTAGGDISPSGASAEVSRNLANAGTTVTGSFNGDDESYVLTVYGAAAAAGSEFAATGITTLNVEDSADYTTAIAAEVGDVNVDDTSELANGGTLTVTGSIDNEGTISGSDVEITGASSAHSNTGAITSDLYVYATGVTLTGTTDDSFDASIDNLIVGDSVTPTAGAITITNIQEIDGDVDVDENGWASIGLAGDDGDAGTAGSGDEGTVNGGVTVADGGSVIWTSDAGIDGDVTGAGVSTFDFNGNTVTMDVGSDFDTEDEAVFGTSGTLEYAGAGTLGTEGAVLPGLTANTGTVTLNSDVAVSGTTTIEDTAIIATGANNLDVAGAVALDATTSGGVTGSMSISGTTVTLASDYTVTGTLEIDATSVDFAAGDAADDWAFTVTGGYTQTAGAVSLTNVDLALTGGTFDYTAGTFAAASDDDVVVFGGSALDTNDGTLTIPNVEVATGFTVGSDDSLVISENAELSADITADGTASAGGTVTFGVAGGTVNILANGGNATDADDADATVTHAGTVNIEYDGTGTTADELPDVVNTFTVSAGVTLEDSAAREANITVTTLNLDAAGLNLDPGADDGTSLTIADGGAVVASVDAPFTNDVFLLDGAYDLTYDGTTSVTGATWLGTPAATTIASDVDLTGDESTVDFTVETGDTFDLTTFDLTVEGDLTNDGTIVSGGGGVVVFGGATAQTLTGGLSGVPVEVANDLTLVGGNLDMTAAAACPNNLILTSGAITTGDNAVELCHVDTGDQGFTRTGGVVNGNVDKFIDYDGVAAVSPNRVEFPTGDASATYRPFAITFNDISQLGTDITLTTGYSAMNAGGTNGFPISAVDDLGATFTVSRYSTEFHWRVEAQPSITPSIDYDVEYRAEGFANFAAEDIEKTRAIRRQDGNDSNFWIKVANGASDNDNYAVAADEPVMVARNAVGAVNADGVLFAIGLEQNLVGSAVALSMNAGGSKTTTVADLVSGGSPPYTITYTGDDAVATASDDGTTVTVVGVGAGTTAIAVSVTDSFGETTSGTINATVNAAFAAGTALADLDAVLVGAADATVDASGMTSGGTAPIVYTIDAGTDAAVATATIDAATGEVTVTYGTPGTTTFTVTATDAEGDVVTDDFTASVAAAAGANGTLVNQTVNNGADGTAQDLSAEFTGTGPFTYAASSSDDDVATAAADDTAETVTATGVSPYVVVSGAVTADAAPATITVTATDAFGSTVSSTFDVEVNPVLGNVDGSGGASPASASLALDGFLGLAILTAKQTTAADYNTDASVTPFDAALIFDAWLNPTPGAASKKEFAANPASDVSFGEVNMQVTKVTIPVTLTGDQAAAVSFSFETAINSELATVTGVAGVEGWTIRHIVGEDGSLRIAGFGLEAIPSDGVVATISLELTSVGTEFAMRGQGAVNNNPATDIEGIDVVELPENFALLGNYPNPFNPSTNISFDLPASADVSVEVYDMLGRRVMVLPMQTIQAGSKRSVQLNASQLASGSYFYRVIAQMESKTQVDNGRMLLIK